MFYKNSTFYGTSTDKKKYKKMEKKLILITQNLNYFIIHLLYKLRVLGISCEPKNICKLKWNKVKIH